MPRLEGQAKRLTQWNQYLSGLPCKSKTEHPQKSISMSPGKRTFVIITKLDPTKSWSLCIDLSMIVMSKNVEPGCYPELWTLAPHMSITSFRFDSRDAPLSGLDRYLTSIITFPASSLTSVLLRTWGMAHTRFHTTSVIAWRISSCVLAVADIDESIFYESDMSFGAGPPEMSWAHRTSFSPKQSTRYWWLCLLYRPDHLEYHLQWRDETPNLGELVAKTLISSSIPPLSPNISQYPGKRTVLHFWSSSWPFVVVRR